MAYTTGVAVDSKSGELWTATQGGLFRQDKNTWHRYTSANSGLASDSINAIRLYDSKVWLCTTRGLSVFIPKTSTWMNYHIISQAQSGEVRFVAEEGAARKHKPSLGGNESNVFNVVFHGSEIWLASEAGLSIGALVQTKPIGEFHHHVDVASQTTNTRPYSKVASKFAPSPYLSNQPTINIGFFGPVENSPDVPYGLSMMHGAQLAVDEANDQGGYSDRIHKTHFNYELKIHNDSAPWGASTTEPVDMALDEHVIAILGSIDGAATHTLLSVAKKLGIPVVNTGTTDPSITDMDTPWLTHLMPDDRQQSRALARYIAGQKRIHKIGIVREDVRYARVGTEAFTEAARQTGLTSVIEKTFQLGDSDFTPQLQELRDASVDGVVLWCHPAEGATILKQMHALGMQIPAFGPGYLASPVLIELAGTAAEGFVATSVLNPERASVRSQHFEKSYRNRYSESPDAYASYAYDGTNLLIEAIEMAGPNREEISEVLHQDLLNSYQAASGSFLFDSSLKNVAPLTMARVEGGRFVYWVPNAVR
jgi:ABC-type branched-subunit amino acid transport system substrate-binding protein